MKFSIMGESILSNMIDIEIIKKVDEKEAEMEPFRPPPVPKYDANAPKKCTECKQPSLEEIKPESPSLPSLKGVCIMFFNTPDHKGSCVGGDRFENNCAHFLSDAFIRAGYTELLPSNPHINARCAPAKRPIRARDMWSWFQSKAVRTSRTPTKNTGMWAVFQLNEDLYWGGHVVILDSDQWVFYGTAWYGNWDQYLYQF